MSRPLDLPRPFALPNPFAGLSRRLRAHFAALSAAHAAARLAAALPAGAVRDTGLDPADLIGHPGRQDALPFFLQPGFGRGEMR